MASATGRYVRHIKSWTFLELDHAADVLEQLKVHPGWAVLQQLLDREREDISGLLQSGDKPLEQAEYAMHHGRLGGVTAARDMLDTVLAKHAERAKAENERSAVRV